MPQTSLEMALDFYFSEPVKESKFNGYEVCSLALREENWTENRSLRRIVRSNRGEGRQHNDQLHTLHSPQNPNGKSADTSPDGVTAFFQFTQSFQAYCGPGDYPASNRNFLEVKRGRRVKLTTSPPFLSRLLDNKGSSTSQNSIGFHGLIRG
jgi:hypothetical protein